MELHTFFVLLQFYISAAQASPWIGTEYVALVESTIGSGYTGRYYTNDPLVMTYTKLITPTVPNPTATSTITDVEYYNGVTAIQLVVEPTAGVINTGYDYLNHYATVTYTAPASCSYTTSQSLTTIIPINVPRAAEGLVHPSLVTTTITYKYITDSNTQTRAMLDVSDIPTSVFSSASSYYKPSMYKTCDSYYRTGRTTYVSGGGSTRYSGCSKFVWYIGGSEFSGGYCCSDGCHYTWGISPLALGLAIFFGWFGLFLIIGLIESWFTFRRAMLGQKARRGLPYGFACLCPIVSCLFLITVKKYPAKSPEEQVFLVARWNDMSASSKLGWWLKYLLRRKDPAAVVLARPQAGHTTYTPQPYPSQGGPWYPEMSGPDGAPMAGNPPHGYPPQAYPPQAYSTPPAVSEMSEGGDGQPQSIQPKTVEGRGTERG
ncbi:hypothetical protein N7541_004989 [Penicillium brevicompactum]|uniref:Uncharacterized protein n=1 Tax=Penicillium brevicompactum TaxID=5074 RepID=A0A9W9RD44_PENBR|nr:hypothetical protein N7541_004989 [Penicillium brevicompactum]